MADRLNPSSATVDKFYSFLNGLDSPPSSCISLKVLTLSETKTPVAICRVRDSYINTYFQRVYSSFHLSSNFSLCPFVDAHAVHGFAFRDVQFAISVRLASCFNQ